MLLVQECFALLPWFRDCGFVSSNVQTYVMSREVTEQIVTQSRRLVGVQIFKMAKIDPLPLFDWKKKFCNGKTYKKHKKR